MTRLEETERCVRKLRGHLHEWLELARHDAALLQNISETWDFQDGAELDRLRREIGQANLDRVLYLAVATVAAWNRLHRAEEVLAIVIREGQDPGEN